MGGTGNIDDNVLEHPNGTYRAISLRSFDPATGQWAIWWLDGRRPSLVDPPVQGRFAAGVGRFLGEDRLAGRPIRVRFVWSEITARSARWEQAFSADGGTSWETNRIMKSARTAWGFSPPAALARCQYAPLPLPGTTSRVLNRIKRSYQSVQLRTYQVSRLTRRS